MGKQKKKAADLAMVYVDVDTIVVSEENPRKITTEALMRLARLLDRHGFVDPVIVRKEDMLLIGGHQRIMANRLRNQPDKRIPCVMLEGISDGRAKALMVALNNPKAMGKWDQAKLAVVLGEIDEAGEGGQTGFVAEEIERMLGGIEGADAEAELEPLTIEPVPAMLWIFMGIPWDRYPKVSGLIAELQGNAAIQMETVDVTSRDKLAHGKRR